MSRFKKATARPTHLKAAFMGFQGAGKTVTSVRLAIGLIQMMRKQGVPGAEKPAFMVDTERGNLWIRLLFEAAASVHGAHAMTFGNVTLSDQHLAGLLMVAACPLSYVLTAIVLAAQTTSGLERTHSPAFASGSNARR